MTRDFFSHPAVLASILALSIWSGFRVLMTVPTFNKTVTQTLDRHLPVSQIEPDSNQLNSGSQSSAISKFLDRYLGDGRRDGSFSGSAWARTILGVPSHHANEPNDSNLTASGVTRGATSGTSSQSTNSNQAGTIGNGESSSFSASGRGGSGGSSSGTGGSSSGNGGGGTGSASQQTSGGASASASSAGGSPTSSDTSESRIGDSGTQPKNDIELIIGDDPEYEDPVITKSRESLRSFQQQAYVQFPPPEGMQFLNVDMDLPDDVASIYGVIPSQGVRMIMLARKGPAPVDQVKNFIELAELPHVPPAVGTKMGTPDRTPAPSGSGLQDPYVWTVLHGNKAYVIGLMPRADNEGAYLGIVSGPTRHMEAAEDIYTELFNQFKAIR